MSEISKKFDIVVIGSCNVDLIFYTDSIPKVGETVIGFKFQSGQGGKGANQAVAAARLGARVGMVSKVGKDHFGQRFISALGEEGIDTSHVFVSDRAHTGMANITVDDKGDNSIIIVPGANFDLEKSDIDAAKEFIQQARVVVVQLEIRPEIVKYALEVATEKIKGSNRPVTIVNPAPAIEESKFPEEIYQLSDYFLPNETETASFLGWDQLDAEDESALTLAVSQLKSRGVAGNVMLTIGAKGVFFDGKVISPPVVDKVVDTTGAGDAFVGALAYFVSTRPNLADDERVRRACVVAAESVKRPGTQISFANKTQLAKEIFE